MIKLYRDLTNTHFASRVLCFHSTEVGKIVFFMHDSNFSFSLHLNGEEFLHGC